MSRTATCERPTYSATSRSVIPLPTAFAIARSRFFVARSVARRASTSSRFNASRVRVGTTRLGLTIALAHLTKSGRLLYRPGRQPNAPRVGLTTEGRGAGHWFEPSSAHTEKAPLRRGFRFLGAIRRAQKRSGGKRGGKHLRPRGNKGTRD